MGKVGAPAGVGEGMFDKIRRFFGLGATSAGEPESFDPSRPQRVNPDPPRRDWYARVRARSFAARATADARALDALDAREPVLSRDASRAADELFARVELQRGGPNQVVSASRKP